MQYCFNFPHKGYFCKSSKTDEKKLEVWGGDVTNHTVFESQTEL